MQKIVSGVTALAAAALSVSTAFASTAYERQQQALPLFERDHLIAEPGLLVVAILLAVYLVWKLRRDMRKREEEDKKYRAMIAEAERLQAEEDEAQADEVMDAALDIDDEDADAGEDEGINEAEGTTEPTEAEKPVN